MDWAQKTPRETPEGSFGPGTQSRISNTKTLRHTWDCGFGKDSACLQIRSRLSKLVRCMKREIQNIELITFVRSFWGVFWVDASTPITAAEKWKEIARLGDRDPNEEAGKHWLSNLESPWLLVIDNADHSEESIRSQFPTGERGCILVTTRNPHIQVNNTVGHLELEKLEADEANDLLRKTTNHTPWDDSAKHYAASIAKHLAYLPLALVQAGRAIYHNFCSLQSYIPFFNKALDDFRVRGPAFLFHKHERLGMQNVFRSFSVIYSGLEALAVEGSEESLIYQDALELVNVFSFFHNNDIALSTLTRAGENLQGFAKQASAPPSEVFMPIKRTWSEHLKVAAVALILRLQHQALVLPRIFQYDRSFSLDETRTLQAIDVLVSMSLISGTSQRGTYSMHPLLHLWVRKRLGPAEQALWCQAAVNVLANSIKIPPLADQEGDSEYYIRLLSHIEQAQSVQKEIMEKIQQKRREASLFRRGFLWMSQSPGFTATDVKNSASFSRVYLECSKYNEAEQLQRQVCDFVIAWRGPKDMTSIRIQMFLSGTLWHLGKTDESFRMQQDVLANCCETLTEAHPQTLRVMDALGETCWMRGLLKEAKDLHARAAEGLQNKTSLVREYLRAVDHLGRVHAQYFEYDVAHAKHEEVVKRFAQEFEPHDLDALIAKDNLAMTLLSIDGVERVRRAHELMEDVFEHRRQRLGKEHAYTLWAACNLARVKARLGSLENDDTLVIEAMSRFDAGIEVAQRNLGPNHFGTLFGRQHRANTLFLQRRYAEAEEQFLDIMERQKQLPGARNGSNPDRIGTIGMLVECYEAEGRYVKGVALCSKMLEELDALGAQQHPMWKKATRKREQLQLQVKKEELGLAEEDLEGFGLRRRRTSVFLGHAKSIASR